MKIFFTNPGLCSSVIGEKFEAIRRYDHDFKIFKMIYETEQHIVNWSLNVGFVVMESLGNVMKTARLL